MNKHNQDLFQDKSMYSIVPYVYSFYGASIAAAASLADSINIDSSSYFIWQKTTYFCDIAGAVQTDSSRVLPLISMQITDSGSAQQLFDQAQPLCNIAGYGSIPAILTRPYVFSPNSNAQAVFNNYSAATTYLNLYVSLVGYRAFKL